MPRARESASKPCLASAVCIMQLPDDRVEIAPTQRGVRSGPRHVAAGIVGSGLNASQRWQRGAEQ